MTVATVLEKTHQHFFERVGSTLVPNPSLIFGGRYFFARCCGRGLLRMATRVTFTCLCGKAKIEVFQKLHTYNGEVEIGYCEKCGKKQEI